MQTALSLNSLKHRRFLRAPSPPPFLPLIYGLTSYLLPSTRYLCYTFTHFVYPACYSPTSISLFYLFHGFPSLLILTLRLLAPFTFPFVLFSISKWLSSLSRPSYGYTLNDGIIFVARQRTSNYLKEYLHRRATKRMPWLRAQPYEELLKRLDVFTFEKRWEQGDSTQVLKGSEPVW